MTEYDRAKLEAEGAMRRLAADYADALEAFHQLEAAHRRGDYSAAAAGRFHAKAGQVHTDFQATRVACDNLRRAK